MKVDEYIIEKPITISTAKLEMGTFLTADQQEEDPAYAHQLWIFLADKHKYLIQYITPIDEFNSPENVEIVDHFIKSVKIASSNKNP